MQWTHFNYTNNRALFYLQFLLVPSYNLDTEFEQIFIFAWNSITSCKHGNNILGYTKRLRIS